MFSRDLTVHDLCNKERKVYPDLLLSLYLILLHFIYSGGNMSTPSGSFTNLSGNPGMGGGMNMGNMGNSGAMTPQQVQQAAQSLSTSESLLGHILLIVHSVLGDTL